MAFLVTFIQRGRNLNSLGINKVRKTKLIDQKRTQKPVKHLSGAFCKKSERLLAVSYLSKTLHVIYLKGF